MSIKIKAVERAQPGISGDKCYVEGISDGEKVITEGQVFLF
jgi:hypothetical protein